MGDRTGVREQHGGKKLRVATHSPPPPISKNEGGLGGLRRLGGQGGLGE